jgi:hypothetical protein
LDLVGEGHGEIIEGVPGTEYLVPSVPC